jgi:hypothetical protein
MSVRSLPVTSPHVKLLAVVSIDTFNRRWYNAPSFAANKISQKSYIKIKGDSSQ